MLDIKIKYVLAFVDIYVIFYIKNFDIKIKPKSDISINALVCGCVRWCAVDFSIKIVVFLTLKFEVIIKMHLRYMSTKNLILTSKNPSFKRLKNLTLMSSNSLGINIKIIEILILIPKSQIGDRPCKYLSLVSDNCWIYWILMPIQIDANISMV